MRYIFFLQFTVTLLASLAQAFQPLNGVKVTSLQKTKTRDGPEVVDIGDWLSTGNCLLAFGTYAADFNDIEYGQRLRYYWPKLREENKVDKCAFLLNCQPAAAKKLRELVDLPDSIEIWVDNTGESGRAFGVERGWLPDRTDFNPYLKLFGVFPWGLGAWATLPAIIGGWIGNPFTPQLWIEDALAVGQRQGRWPNNALELDEDGSVKVNNFSELPLVGSWKRRPFELATLRLQSMLGISLANWKDLAPDQEALDAGVLTQLGGCIVVENNETVFERRDPGVCAVANFEDIVKTLS
jgi:hypothetical protein